MFKYRRSALALVGGGTLALTSIVGLSSPAQAATGAEILVPFRFSIAGAQVLPQTFTAGDCRQVGQNQAASMVPSYLTVQKYTTVQNLYKITWNPTLYTVSTWQQDVWHARFVFRNSAGPIGAVTFEGPYMNGNTIYSPHLSQDVPLTTDQANAVTFVDWIGDC